MRNSKFSEHEGNPRLVNIWEFQTLLTFGHSKVCEHGGILTLVNMRAFQGW